MKYTRILLVIALLGAAAFGLPSLRGATITVTLAYDNYNNDPGTLRRALADANDGDTITFDSSLFAQIINLTAGQLVVNKNVTIIGLATYPYYVAVDGRQRDRVFYIAPGKTVTISNLKIQGGSAPAYTYGGGIHNDHATLTLKNCPISGNEAWQGVGGGISNDQGTLTVSNCTISGNSSLYGAGISTNSSWQGSATVTIANSTISGHSVPGFGGGIHNEGGAALTIISSTLSGNSAGYGGGGIYNGATVTITNSTLSGNSVTYEGGGGIHNDGTVNIGHTILNAGPSGENIYNSFGTVTSLGYNLSSDNGGGYLTVTGDQINTDPRLGPLQDNGGPLFTHLPAPDSPALNAGDPALGMDQRGAGFQRVVNGRIDIGAIEVQATPTPTPRPHGRR